MTGGTTSNWEFLIIVFGIVAPFVIGAWTAWNRHLTYKQYLIAFVAIWAAVIITQALHRQGGWIAVLQLATQPLVLFTGVHFMVRRSAGDGIWVSCR